MTYHKIRFIKILFTVIILLVLFSKAIILYIPHSPSSNKFFKENLKILKYGNPSQIKELLEKGLNLKTTDRFGNTPLLIVARFNKDPKVIELLIHEGADIHETDNEGNTALIWASSKNNSSVIEELLRHDPLLVNKINSKGISALMVAARNNNSQKVLTTLISAGANLNLVDSDGFLPLHHALISNIPEQVSFLLKHTPKFQIQDQYGRNLLMFLAQFSGNPENIKPLIDSGININAKDSSGKTALNFAIEEKNYILAKKLIEYGALKN